MNNDEIVDVECPNCGNDCEVAASKLPTKVGCPSCRTVFLAEPVGEAKPWYLEPVILGAIAFCGFVLLGFMGYVISDSRSKARKAEVRAIKAQGDSQFELNPREALTAYDTFLKKAQEYRADPVFRSAIQEAQSKKQQLENNLKAELEQEDKEARQREVLALKEKLQSEAQQQEREQEKQEQEELLKVVREKKDERNRLARFEAKVSGGAFLIKKLGNSEIQRGLSIIVLAAELSDGTDLTDAYVKSRKFPETWSSDKQREEILEDREFIDIAKKGFVDSVKTDIDGKYELKLKGGKYVFYSMYTTEFGLVEWLVPVAILSSEDVKLDFSNSNATFILNKGDDD